MNLWILRFYSCFFCTQPSSTSNDYFKVVSASYIETSLRGKFPIRRDHFEKFWNKILACSQDYALNHSTWFWCCVGLESLWLFSSHCTFAKHVLALSRQEWTLHVLSLKMGVQFIALKSGHYVGWHYDREIKKQRGGGNLSSSQTSNWNLFEGKVKTNVYNTSGALLANCKPFEIR